MINQPNEVKGLRPMIVGPAGTRIARSSVHSTAKNHFYALRERILKVSFKDGNNAVFAACILAIILGDLGHRIAITSYVIEDPLFHHHGHLLIIKALPMLDAVHSAND